MALSDSEFFDLRVRNAAPSLFVDAPDTATSGRAVAIHLMVHDPGVLDAPWSWEVDWGGDGLRDRGEHAYQNHRWEVRRALGAVGSRWIRIRVSDKDGDASDTSIRIDVRPRRVRVAKVPPAVPLTVRPEDEGVPFLRLAILGEPNLDATRILVPSVTLAQAGGILVPSRRGDGSIRSPVADVNGDGILDLVLFLDPGSVSEESGEPVVVRGVLPGGYVVEGSWVAGS